MIVILLEGSLPAVPTDPELFSRVLLLLSAENPKVRASTLADSVKDFSQEVKTVK